MAPAFQERLLIARAKPKEARTWENLDSKARMDSGTALVAETGRVGCKIKHKLLHKGKYSGKTRQDTTQLGANKTSGTVIRTLKLNQN